MQTTWREALHTLERGETLRIHGGLGSSVIVFGGRVWLTQDGDLRDIHLGPGESFTLDVAAPALLQALAPAQVMLAEPQQAPRVQGAAERLRAWLGERLARALGPRRLHVEHRPLAA